MRGAWTAPAAARLTASARIAAAGLAGGSARSIGTGADNFVLRAWGHRESHAILLGRRSVSAMSIPRLRSREDTSVTRASGMLIVRVKATPTWKTTRLSVMT